MSFKKHLCELALKVVDILVKLDLRPIILDRIGI